MEKFLEKKGLSIDYDPEEKITGIYLSYETQEGEDIGMEAKILACLSSPEIGWPISISMICGETVCWKDISEFPREKLMCPCGNPNHIIVDFKL